MLVLEGRRAYLHHAFIALHGNLSLDELIESLGLRESKSATAAF
jgi:hypothetical protein